MTTFSDMKQEDQDLLAGLPYRAGVWASHADDVAGEGDDKREKKAIEEVIASCSRKMEGFMFVSEVMRETLKSKGRWKGWTADPGDVPGDCRKAMALLDGKINKTAFRNYRHALFQIAMETAGAHGEFGDIDEEKGFVARLLDGMGGKRESFMNVSASENDALDSLAAALKIKRFRDQEKS